MLVKKITISLLFLLSASPVYCLYTIMIDPAGDATDPGRSLLFGFERGLAFSCAEHVKEQLESMYPEKIRVVLSRLPGEKVEPLQTAQFANRLAVDLFVSLAFFQESSVQSLPSLAVYSYTNENTPLTPEPEGLHFWQYDKTYKAAVSQTALYHKLFDQQAAHHASKLRYIGSCALPCKPLVGITAPAFLLEIGVIAEGDISLLVADFIKELVVHGIDYRERIV